MKIAFESVAMATVVAEAMEARNGQPQGLAVSEFVSGQQRQLGRG